ncbi:hypothetical protein [Sphaerisporangium sp. NPDC051011]|uniref:hypothetical protein n=1 Tax=Sphaerisporangium sp. NPDC051011 TaxID=3155792 RepID=UPI0033FB06D8
MRAHINTDRYVASHAKQPLGQGAWIFENKATKDQVERTGMYGQVTRQLPESYWYLLP